jgi:hypothetical protein
MFFLSSIWLLPRFAKAGAFFFKTGEIVINWKRTGVVGDFACIGEAWAFPWCCSGRSGTTGTFAFHRHPIGQLLARAALEKQDESARECQ